MEAGLTKKPKERQCDECGYVPLRRFARAGRTEKFKGLELELPATLELTECESCGERYDSGDDGEILEHLLRELYAACMRKSLEASLGVLTAERSLAEIERQLCLAEGYLSKVKKSEMPSLQLVGLLALLATDPGRGLDVIASVKQGESPPPTAESLVRSRKRA